MKNFTCFYELLNNRCYVSKKQLLILMTLFMSVISYSQVFTENFISYAVTSTTANTVRVFNYDTAGGTIVNIPATVTNTSVTPNVTYSVTSIQQLAFNGDQITQVTIPNGITSIGLFAFQSNQLTSVVIPNSVTSIGLGAFQSNQLSSVTMPIGLTIIEDQVFFQNELVSVSIPSSVTSIGQAAFRSNQLTSVTIPASVTSIGNGAFRANPLTDVTSLATTPPTILTGGATDSFAIDRSSINLTIPTGTEDVYVTDPGALWTGFNSVNGVSLSNEDFELTNDIKVFTTSSEIKVITSNTVRLENYTIYSISGAKIKEGTESTIDIDAISNGIYIIELNFDKGTLVKKVVLY